MIQPSSSMEQAWVSCLQPAGGPLRARDARTSSPRSEALAEIGLESRLVLKLEIRQTRLQAQRHQDALRRGREVPDNFQLAVSRVAGLAAPEPDGAEVLPADRPTATSVRACSVLSGTTN